jgi:hypothetical protein
MQPMTFHPVVADIGAQVVQIGMTSLEASGRASTALTGLAPAGAEEVSALAVTAFHQEAASMLELQQAAQQELMRAGAAFTQIARAYADVDESAAKSLVFNAVMSSNPTPH